MEIIYIFIIIAAVAYIIYELYKFRLYVNTPVEVFENIVLTISQLHEYDGVKKKQIFIAINDYIYNVTNSNSYKNGGEY